MFENAKVGDRVRSIIDGWCEVSTWDNYELAEDNTKEKQ